MDISAVPNTVEDFCLASAKSSTCMECGDKTSLWYCIACGHIGCSRHKQGHALAHYNNTKHSVSMELRTLHTWDYVKGSYIDNLLVDLPMAISKDACKCPVCRYHQIPKIKTHASTTCMSCEVNTNLWLCLSCNHIGCGRHERRHSLGHYYASQHNHAMHLDNFSIWSYKEDKYVHRRLHNENIAEAELIPLVEACIVKKEPVDEEDNFEKRIKLLETEWKNFSKLKETNRQMISIEQRLIGLSEEKKLLEGKVREHDAKLNELLNQFKDGNQNEVLPSSSSCSRNSVTQRPMPNNPIITLSVSENLEQTQLIIFFILLLFIYHFVHLFVQAITGKT